MTNKTWEEEFDEMSEIEEFWGLPYDHLVDKVVKQFISDLRKRDMEALIGMIDEYFRHLIIIPRPDLTSKKLLQLIQDYYEN